MGLYSHQVLPRCLAWVMGWRRFAEHRARSLQHLSGRVLELGFGAGHNLPHYPPGVREVLALEPATLNRRLAVPRIRQSPIPVEWVGLHGEEIPLEDSSVDAVASTFTMCSIGGLEQALAEVRRVLRPGGSLHFVEHGLSPTPELASRQRRNSKFTKACFGGCHLDRAFDSILRCAGFELRTLSHPTLRGPRVTAHLYEGIATPR